MTDMSKATVGPSEHSASARAAAGRSHREDISRSAARVEALHASRRDERDDLSAANPLWVLAIAMAAFFGALAMMMGGS
jgi:hypothetical protein